MKYSILVLGASISISLFIRICCALEANTLYKDPTGGSGIFTEYRNVGEDNIEDLFHGRADEVYEQVLKYTVSKSLEGFPNLSPQKADKIANDWFHDLKSSAGQVGIHSKSKQQSKNAIQESQDEEFNHHICGNDDPPNLQVPECTGSNCICECSAELPDGCEYDETDQYMKCSDRDITSIPPLPPALSILDLNETRIQKVPKVAFRNVSIKTIRLFRNTIEFIHPWAFHDVESLQNLFINDNLIKYLSFEIYVGLNHTTTLHLQNNLISFEIYQNCQERPVEDITPVLPNLKVMTLSGNPLKIIPKQMFAGLRNSPLSMLYLDNCYLERIDSEAFTYLKNLSILNLSRNPQLMPTLTSALEGISGLKKLFLSYNGLQQIPINALSRFSDQLEAFDFSGNYLETVQKDSMSHFPELKELYLDACNILNIEDEAFRDLAKLRVLSLRNNRIRQLPSFFPATLFYLCIENTNPTLIRSNPISFKNLTKLQTLELSGIQLDKIEYNSTLSGLTSVRRVFLDRCNIQYIEDKAFEKMSNLELLSLRNNLISELSSEVFYGLESLETLYMSSCNLSFPTSDSDNKSVASDEYNSPFRHLKQLKTLDLSDNKIMHISDKIFQNLTNLSYIYISNNPIESWKTPLFPNRTNSRFDDINLLEMTITHGNLQFLTDAMTQDFVHMSTIDLSYNRFVCNEGACTLRNMIKASLQSLDVDKWTNSEEYRCIDIETVSVYQIIAVPDEVCQKSGLLSESSGTTLLISLTASLSLITAVVIILAYKNRVHLKYFFFVVKLNVMQTPRKAKLSTMESSSFDYDVFVSYHQDDSKFIQDVFLPEIEMQESYTEEREAKTVLNEARNQIYTIQNDLNKAKSNKQKFRVCLHERDFEAGVPITENIVNCVDRCRNTLIFVSKKYMESQWCSFEMNLVYHRMVESRRRSFVLVLMEETPAETRTKVLNYLMVSKTYLQWPGMNGSEDEKAIFWRRLRSFLQPKD